MDQAPNLALRAPLERIRPALHIRLSGEPLSPGALLQAGFLIHEVPVRMRFAA
jgi:hypothetical protein